MLYKYFVFAEIMAPVWFIFDYILFTGEYRRVPSICITFVQCRTNVEDVGATLYRCYTDVFLFAMWYHLFHDIMTPVWFIFGYLYVYFQVNIAEGYHLCLI